VVNYDSDDRVEGYTYRHDTTESASEVMESVSMALKHSDYILVDDNAPSGWAPYGDNYKITVIVEKI
jgi:hypothetical protein